MWLLYWWYSKWYICCGYHYLCDCNMCLAHFIARVLRTLSRHGNKYKNYVLLLRSKLKITKLSPIRTPPLNTATKLLYKPARACNCCLSMRGGKFQPLANHIKVWKNFNWKNLRDNWKNFERRRTDLRIVAWNLWHGKTEQSLICALTVV